MNARTIPRFLAADAHHASEALSPSSALREVALAGPLLPGHSRVTSFSAGLGDALATEYRALTCTAVSVDDRHHNGVHTVRHHNGAACRNAARLLNTGGAEVVCLQHACGIYGGTGGSCLLDFLDELKKPLVTTFHDVEPEPTGAEHRVMEALFRASARLVTTTHASRDVLRESYDVPLRMIDVIPHGIPDLPLRHPLQCKEEVGLGGRKVLLTCGHLRPGKGIEHVIQALPAVVHKHPDVLYVVMGATDPHVLETHGESYRQQLKGLVQSCGVTGHVLFVNRFVREDELNLHIGASDLCLSPQDVDSRTCSTMLSRMVGMGRAVISTPCGHARELLAERRGRLVRFASSMAISSAILDLLGDSVALSEIRQRAWEHGRHMVWSRVARAYMDCLQSAAGQPAHARGMKMEKRICHAA